MSIKPYPKYKDSGVEWLGMVPEYWEVWRIKHLGTTITGGTPKTDEPDYWIDGNVPWLPSGKVQNNSIHKEDADTFITKRALAESAAKLIRPGSALIALTGATCANAAFLTFESTANQSVVGIEPKLNADGRFIYYSLLSQRKQVLTHKSGGAQGGINQEDVRNLVITAPEKAEQSAIASFLDHETAKIDALIFEQEKLIELLKEKRSAVISHAVTKGLNPDVKMKESGVEWLGMVPEHWEVVPLKRIMAMQSGETITSESIEDFGDFPVFGGNGFRGYSSEFTHDGDYVLIGRQGALCGNINYASGKFWASEHAVVCSPIVPVSILWLGEMLRAMNLNQYSVSAAQPGLSVEIVANIRTIKPPIKEQEFIASFLKAELGHIKELTEKNQLTINLLQERRSALISAAVTGQIDVRNFAPYKAA